MNLKVLQVCRIGWPHEGGMEGVVRGLALALAARGHHVEVATLRRAVTDGTELPPGSDGPVRYHRLARLGPRRYPLAVGLVGLARGFDLLHVHGIDGLADQLVMGRRVHQRPVVVSTHGGYLHTPRTLPAKWLALRTVTRSTLARADAVWFTSAADRDGLAATGAVGPVVGNGVDLAWLADVHRRPEPSRWLCFGRFDRHKGLEDLIRAARAMPRDHPFELEIAGREDAPGLADALRRQVGEAGLTGRVRIVGYLDRVALRERLERAELAVFPSRYEGFGVAVVEALASGVPVVLRDIPAHRALVGSEHPGLVDLDDPEATARTLIDVAAGAEAIGALGPELARPHGWDVRVVDIERRYRTLARRA